MRLFAAICLSPAVRASLADAITTLRGQERAPLPARRIYT